MNIFKTFTLTWWEGACFKWGIFLLGIAAGAYWHAVFTGFLPLLFVVAAILLAYVTYVWWRQ